MKRIILLLIIAVSLLIGCSSEKLLSDKFKMDLEQVVPIIEKTYESKLGFTEDEKELMDNFSRRYKHGQYHVGKEEGYHEMNDLEKAIFNEALLMILNVDDLENLTTKLESEKDDYNYYKQSKEELDRLMGVKSIKKLPNEYKDKYPTYEVGAGIYPKQFEEDMNEFIERFDPIVNGYETNVNTDDSKVLEMIFNEYNMEGMDRTGVPNEYEQGGKYYLVNPQMSEGIIVVRSIIADINEGFISGDTTKEFNDFKENMELFRKN